MPSCSQCGSGVHSDDAFCLACGVRQLPSPAPASLPKPAQAAGTPRPQPAKRRTHSEQVVLAHFIGTSDYRMNPRPGVRASWKETYTVQPLSFTRPPSGKSRSGVRCNKCGEAMDLQVASVSRCRWHRAIAAIVLGIISIPIPLALMFFIPVFICIFLPPGLQGVRLVAGAGSQHRHSVKVVRDGKLK